VLWMQFVRESLDKYFSLKMLYLKLVLMIKSIIFYKLKILE
jgi:hypothetical protein